MIKIPAGRELNLKINNPIIGARIPMNKANKK